MPTETQRTQFDYLLNAFEQASQSDTPAAHGYAEKRAALFAYVRGLELDAVLLDAAQKGEWAIVPQVGGGWVIEAGDDDSSVELTRTRGGLRFALNLAVFRATPSPAAPRALAAGAGRGEVAP